MAVSYDASVISVNTVGTSATQAHTAALGADVFVAVVSDTNVTFGQITGVTYNGTAMTLEGTAAQINAASFNYGYLYLYRSAGAGTGSPANAVVSFPDSGPLGVVVASYPGVTSVSGYTTHTGTGTTPTTGSISLSTSQMILSIIATGTDTTTAVMSSPTGGTNRQLGNATSGDVAIAWSDSTSTATFGATLSPSVPWGAITLLLNGAAGTTVTPTGATVALTGSVPVVTAGGSVSTVPTGATVHLTPGTPVASISGPISVSPATATVHLTTGTPGVTASFATVVTPTTATIHITTGKAWAIKNPFDIVFGKLAAGLSATILVTGDSTSRGANDENYATEFGWGGRLAILIGQYYNANVVVQVPSGGAPPSWFGSPTTIYTSTAGGTPPTLTLLDAGVDGATINSLAIFQADIFSDPVDLMILQDGFNETLPAGFGAVYLSFLNYGQGLQPGIPSIITTENNYIGTNSANGTSFASIFAALVTEFLPGQTLPLSPVVQKSSAAPLTWMVDTQQANIPSGDITNAGIHPNGTGYGIYANYLLDQFAPSIASLTASPASAVVSLTGGTPALTGIAVNTNIVPTGAVVALSGGTPVVSGLATRITPTTALITITCGTPTSGEVTPRLLTLVSTTTRRYALLNP